ncbi:hypothetical protein PZ938_10250 [Luteipulveratus sp. YIM 133132]|uniref:DUF2613 domain-containing protein n=1 Tax=Luteipulveratus flavus TaxID=3031728 RepID=A0ABT6C9X1_9MICO|nr:MULTISPECIES: hypothetical protein [unclassified Luteipulveratus]MDE9365984.1 hypothetical protein [Luteipulveratus sp. YIM 133132]MDF8264086.1 hypothetical protein [Luteipulveratus sp. YIM 133296]
MGTSGNKTAWNIGGAVVGVLLAGLAIFGLVQSQNSIKQPQTYNNVISYDS